jgi:hypothetical protein
MARRAPRIRRTPALLPLLLLATLARADPAVAPASGEQLLQSLPPMLATRLERERVVMLEGQGTGRGDDGDDMIQALVLFERPRNEVIRYLIQGPRQIEFRPELREARLVEEFDGGQVIHYEMRMMLMKIEYQARHGWDFETGRIWWSLDPDFDNDFEKLEGRWEVRALGPRRALARFGTRIDVGRALPSFVQDMTTRSKLPEAMQNVRRWVDSGGTYRP